MHMLNKRMQLLLDESRYRLVAEEARRRRVSMAVVIRDAIDRLPLDRARRHTAMSAILAADLMPVPADPADLRRELDEAHDRIR